MRASRVTMPWKSFCVNRSRSRSRLRRLSASRSRARRNSTAATSATSTSISSTSAPNGPARRSRYSTASTCPEDRSGATRTDTVSSACTLSTPAKRGSSDGPSVAMTRPSSMARWTMVRLKRRSSAETLARSKSTSNFCT